MAQINTVKDLEKAIKNARIQFDVDDDPFEVGIEWVNKVTRLLPKLEHIADKQEISTDGVEILFQKEDDCERIADLFDEYIFSGLKESHTGYYDPEEDRRSGEMDSHTGKYWLDFGD